MLAGLAAKGSAGMTNKQYADIQRIIGRLEGMGEFIPQQSQGSYYDAVVMLSDMIDEIWKEEQDG